MTVAQIRVARPTDRLAEVVAFYEDGLGLVRVGGFKGHAGYTGVMLEVPGTDVHLEFTSHSDGSPCPAPTLDNLLVLYCDTAYEQRALIDRLAAAGHDPVAPENPFWADHGGVTVADPDGWRVVVMPARAY